MDIRPTELVGQRVKIVPMELHHVPEVYAAGDHPEIWTYMSMRVASLEDAQRLVQAALQGRADGSEFPFAILDLKSGKLVGSTRFLDISHANRSLEIGWTWLSPNAWRTRINTECKYLLLKHCFETLGTIRVQLKTDKRNRRSQAAIERLGATNEGVLRNHRILADGYVRDSVYYSILDREWELVRTRLEENLGG